LQVNCAGRFALIDPLAIADVSPLLELLDVHELWFHGADYDLTMLRRSYGWSPRVIRDTQIAARLLGARQFGLAALVKNNFEIELCKASQKADWSRRPLPPNMLSYAVDDVRFLQEDVAARDNAAREDPWRVQGCGRLQPRGLAILKGMWEWREGIAKERDTPCFKIMSNKQMAAYAEQFEAGQPLNPPNGWRPRWKKEFQDIIVAVTSSDPSSWPARPKKTKGRLSDTQRDQIDKLCAHREKVALELEIEPSLLGSRSTIEELVIEGNPANHLMSWQHDLMARGLEQVLQTE
jgi:ribonuclease D